uniref:Exonuclease domain-containing protein n=1 Tax=Mola mola TaxID=94237 RepID=A0A3Q3X6D2_MOLML
MFPSSGLFALLDCPLSKRGACERPYCLYRHAAEIRDKSGLQYSESGESLSDQVTDVCLQELERINREIESVRHEVEQEQRRLSHYQTAQANGQNTASVSKSETEGRLVDRDSRGLSTDSKKTCYQRKKYMVDNSKPRTDLEYDPLSNFSADLLKTDQGLKRARNTGSCDQKKPVTFQPRPSSLPSLEPLDEWNDNDVLIIDIPPSPVKKREQVQTPLHSVSGKPLPNNAEELKEVKPVPILLCAKAELSKAAAGGDVEENQSKCAENQKVSNPQSLTNAPSVLPHSQKTSSNIPGLMQGKAAVSQAPPESCLKQAEWVGQAPQTVLTSGLTKTAESLSRSSEQLSVNADNSCIIVAESSSDDDEPNYSDVELSDSDPMEECYRIFMEENQKGNVEPDMSPVPTKRKLKHQNEATKDKVPHDVRQRYVNMFTEEFLKTTANVNDAFQKALAEERTVYNRSVNKLKYMSVAVNALKKLKNHTALAAKADDVALYESLKDYILTEEKLIESNYPFQHPEKSGCAILFADNKKGTVKRICCRCGATYSVSQMGKHTRKEECNYHYGKGVTRRVPGGVETRYNCCEGVMGAPGCQVFKLHVHDSLSLDGFVSTVPKHPDTSCPGVYSLDCEMCYTIHGLELSRVTLVNSGLQVVYDTFVRPDSEVIDYNTRFSGISEEDVKGIHTSLKEVQETLLSFINADTILIGHGLETDLCALKLLHWTVVDTSVVFPHRLGPPHKLTLNNLTAEYLRRIIQESVCGHDTAEDAAACMELMLWKIKEDGKLKK